jgi:hypothetical protein
MGASKSFKVFTNTVLAEQRKDRARFVQTSLLPSRRLSNVHVQPDISKDLHVLAIVKGNILM